MRIDDLRPDRLSQSAERPVAPARPAAPNPAAPVVPPARTDTVVISAEARALAALQAGASVQGALTPERVLELRRWLAAGGHNDPDVIRRVAEQIVGSGDLAATASAGE